MKRYVNEKHEGIIAILAAFFVMFCAMIDPLVLSFGADMNKEKQ